MATILLVSGSTRSASTNTAALRTIAAAPGVDAVLYDELAALPAFNPDDDVEPLPPSVARLREAIRAAAGVLFCTPEYAGTLPGSFKNLLDWTVGGGEMDAKPVGWINVAAPGRGSGADATLRVVLSYVNATVVDDACAQIEVRRDAVGPDGTVDDQVVAAQLVAIADALVTSARRGAGG